MKKFVIILIFSGLIIFSTQQLVFGEIEGDEERNKDVTEVSEMYKRQIIEEDAEVDPDKIEVDPKIKLKESKLKKKLITEEELDEITLRSVWRYVDKQFNLDENLKIESMKGLLRDTGRVYDPIVNKYKVATIQIEIIKYHDEESLQNYWNNEKESNLEFMFENSYLVGSPINNTKCFFNYATNGAITICKTNQYVIQSIIFDKYQEHFKYTKSKIGSEKLELNQYEITTKITETILKKLQTKDTNYDYELYKILKSNREMKEIENHGIEQYQKEKKQRENAKKDKNKSLGIEKDKKYGIQKFSCIKDEFGLITISGQFNNNHIKKDKVNFEIVFFDFGKNIIFKNNANLLEIEEYETKRFLGNLKIDKNFATCTIKLNN